MLREQSHVTGCHVHEQPGIIAAQPAFRAMEAKIRQRFDHGQEIPTSQVQKSYGQAMISFIWMA